MAREFGAPPGPGGTAGLQPRARSRGRASAALALPRSCSSAESNLHWRFETMLHQVYSVLAIPFVFSVHEPRAFRDDGRAAAPAQGGPNASNLYRVPKPVSSRDQRGASEGGSIAKHRGALRNICHSSLRPQGSPSEGSREGSRGSGSSSAALLSPRGTEGRASGPADGESAFSERTTRRTAACRWSSPPLHPAGGGLVAGLQLRDTPSSVGGRILITDRVPQT